MAANTGALAGKTLFISGASRGIGKAIALKAAKDGANVVIAAKTATAHPKLPGTIYTAAEEIKQAGGEALPCVVDIRNEEQVKSTVDEAVRKFGGIDILVNNASAISLTPTLKTPMKTYDLMNGINARGTYLCSQACLPHLLKADNPHILNISPPLNLNPKWFKGHVAYTMAKYGMSFCVLGMSEEFKDDGVAVNALWPRTAIWTAAMEMLGGGGEIKESCRTVDIMSDAAYVILSRNSRDFTGNFAIDDEVLESAGVNDLDQYACVPGSTLLPDFFLDVGPDHPKLKDSQDSSSSSDSDNEKIPEAFTALKTLLTEQLVNEVKASYQFNLSGSEQGDWYIDLKSGAGSAGQGTLESPDCTMALDSNLFLDMFAGKANSTTAFMMGKLKIKGDMMAAMKLEKLMKKMSKKEQ
ncbi:hydroxysteroid dehydrogenase-like protein 2 [Elysia marginata]|uniref:Hydroxysteroid dehydrogenase-like protein 2 n=1 Tax=Elysia marginata TaxID=1093978 RepID=A0AAV4ISQ5_9GAST|nr:hydroxysteroid dehydrogenase-like protein 2 [Elysia marginata]